jgi:terpene synthase-like protein
MSSLLVSDARYPSAAATAPVAALALRLTGDLRKWTAGYGPGLADKAFEAMALSAAVIAPWSDAKSLRLPARAAIWLYGVDDLIDVDASSLAEVDDTLARCISVASGGPRDESHPVLAALSDLYADMREQPLYPGVHELWVEKFTSCMQGMRYSWQTGREQTEAKPSLSEYLEHADSILKWITIINFWIATAGPDLLDHLDVLIPAGDDTSVIIRLANDVATSAREQREGIGNAVLLVGKEQVLAELSRRRSTLDQRLASLLAIGYTPALILTRSAEWAMSFYGVTDFRTAIDANASASPSASTSTSQRRPD